jgi:phenylalanyl-tRNA synthetase beta chain
MDRLRREIVPLHLEKARDNQRYSKAFRFFEVGRVYRKPREGLHEPGLPEERSRLAGVFSFEEKRPENFHEARNTVLSLLEWLRLAGVEALPAAADKAMEPWAHPAVHARICVAGRDCGHVYRVHPEVEVRLELKGDVIAFDVDFDGAFESPRRPVDYHPPCRYPLVPFDVAIEAGVRITSREVLDVIRKAGGDLLRSVEAFDVFQSEKLGAGKKSMAFHLVFGSDERTLEGDEIKKLEDRVTEALRAAGYPLRA